MIPTVAPTPTEPTPTTPVTTPTTGNIMTVHTVVKGDTLGSLATQYYGKFSEWETIKGANKDVLNGKINLSLGQQIKIPAL